MAGILPDTGAGGVVTRSAGGIPANPSNVSNVYVPPEDFGASCALTALPDDCTARITAAQINAIVSELMCFAATLNPTGTWTCSSLCNLATNFDGWLAALGPVMSFNGRSGAVTLTSGDVTGALTYIPVAKVGDTMTGNLAIDKDYPVLLLDANTGTAAYISGVKNGSQRWAMVLGNEVAESGLDVGSDFAIHRYSDAGAWIGAPIEINRATGVVLLNGNTAWHAGNDGSGSGLDADLLDGVNGAAYALLAGPTFTGVPAAPTAAPGTNTTQISTTAFVTAAVAAATAAYALLASPAFTGTPTAPTAAPGTNTTQLATTAFVTAAVAAATTGVSTFNGRSGAVTLAIGDLTAIDGSGSGLDADLLDGQSSAYYLAASSYTAADVLAKLITVDGSGSGLDADLLDGIHASAFAPLSGATFTGNISIDKDYPVLLLDANTGTAAYISGVKNGSQRWAMVLGNEVAESGSNAGTNFAIHRYNDAGSYLGTPIEIVRSTGVVFINGTDVGAGIVSDVRLGTEAYADLGSTSTDYKAPAGNAMTGVQTYVSSGNELQRIYYKPVQKNIGGSWTTVSG